MPTELRRSTCNRDCPDACGLVAEVEDGVLRSLKGDPEHPVTRGFLCFRTSRFPQLASGPQRITQPMRRVSGYGPNAVFEPIDGDEALDLLADRLTTFRRESGPESIFHYRSGGSLGLLKAVSDRFFERFGPCTIKSGDICSGAGEEAQVMDFGVSDSNDLFDLLESRHILCWGKNPTVSSTHTVKVLRDARAKGASIVGLDVMPTGVQAFADEFHTLKPGGDLALALGVARVIDDGPGFDPRAEERCNGLESYRSLVRRRSVSEWSELAGVSVEVTESLARRLLDGPTAILVGWGMQRRARGGAIVRALDALSAVTGNLYRSGGGCSFYFARRKPFADIREGTAPRFVREPVFGSDLLDAASPSVRALWITAGNPVNNLPNSARVAAAIERTEFVVALDCLWNDSNRRADLVLPVPSLVEDTDVLGSYGHHFVSVSDPLIEPPPEVRHEVEWIAGLAQRVGLGEEFSPSVDHWRDVLLAPLAKHGLDRETLQRGAQQAPGTRQVLFEDGKVATADGRVNLIGEQDVDESAFEPADSSKGLWLLSNSHRDSQCGQWAVDLPDRLPIRVHPSACPEGLVDGDEVTVESEVGRLTARLVVDESLRADTVVVPKGGSFDGGTACNILIPEAPTDIGLGAALQECRVRLSRPQA
ncbi:MAG: molybdopterin-dependent oxidoreductase [Planctomycetota bacterium]